MQRGVTVEQVRWATKAAQRHGIQVGMFLMWGYDGETFEDIEATVEHVKETNPDVFFTTVSYPIRNTGYFEKVKDRVVLDKELGGGGRPGLPDPRPPVAGLLQGRRHVAQERRRRLAASRPRTRRRRP